MSLHFDVSPQIEEQFTEAAHQKGIDVSSFFEQMVVEYLNPTASQTRTGKSAADIIREIGLASFEPADLSERVDEYLEKTGFGETRV